MTLGKLFNSSELMVLMLEVLRPSCRIGEGIRMIVGIVGGNLKLRQGFHCAAGPEGSGVGGEAGNLALSCLRCFAFVSQLCV